ncbi:MULTISPECIES: thioesterase II family protein [unclassified Streptomyces]|uniref:thioesterase II family protein n=1 Tax=unclassified Streptomyces TaxID=2593676 RepID=UPI002E2E4441|nr:alpha/beta fold hydrolase [Streptomyces sp. NBC_01439]
MGEATGGTSPWIRQFHPAPAAPVRLILFPHAGGSASFYFPVSRTLAPAVDVVAIQYPGRQDRRHEEGIGDLHDLAEALVAELRPLADRPLMLFGHSMGATLAFEVGRRLEQEGIVPLALFASGRRAPGRARDETVHLRDDEGLVDELKELSGTEPGVLGDEELLRMILPAIRSDYRAAETYRYRPGPDLSCPVHALVGDNDPKVTVDEARSWSDHTSGPFDLRVFDGGHFYLAPHAATVNRLLADCAAAHPAGAA